MERREDNNIIEDTNAMAEGEDDGSKRRDEDIVPLQVLRRLPISIAGVGAGGRPTALQLGAMGTESMLIVDPDTVEQMNIHTQGYKKADVGRNKVDVVSEEIEGFYGEPSAFGVVSKWEEIDKDNVDITIVKVLFVCVDTMVARHRIWKRVRQEVDGLELLIDGRMSAEVLRILTIPMFDDEAVEYYASTLFSDEEAYQDRCTAKMTIYGASVVAGMKICQFTKWLRRNRGLMPERDILFNMLTCELEVKAVNKIGV